MGQWLQRLSVNAKYGSVSDATIQGYLRSASQIETVWQQIDEKVDALLLQGMTPWDAYARMGFALAMVRACRLNVVFAQELLKASAMGKTFESGHVSKLTYDQAVALCEHIEPLLEEAIKASNAPGGMTVRLPLAFGPHIQDERGVLSVPHVQGCMGAGNEAKSWASGLLAKYELAVQAAKIPIPQEVSAHIAKLKGDLELADFHLQSGIDLLGQVSQGEANNAPCAC